MQTIELPDPKFEPLSLGFSADGGLLAAWGWGRACVIDTANGTVRGTFGGKDPGMTELPGTGFTADGRGVIVHSDRYTSPSPVSVIDLASGEVLRKCPEKHGSGMEVGPGGRLLYLTHHPRTYWIEIVRWDPLTGETLPAFAHHKGYLRLLAVSADEKWVAGSTNDTIRVWNLGGTKLPSRATRQLQVSTSGCIYGLAISSDGAFVAYNGPGLGAGDVRTGEVWKVADRGAAHSREVAFHPSRPLLAYSGMSAEVKFYDTAARTELKRYAWGIEQVLVTAFSPDGLRCAAAGVGKVVIWDVDA
jgi:WD40 repeat protein